jgi:hypothetical protein
MKTATATAQRELENGTMQTKKTDLLEDNTISAKTNT